MRLQIWGSLLLGAVCVVCVLLACPIAIALDVRRRPGDWGATSVSVRWLGITWWRGSFNHADFWPGLRKLWDRRRARAADRGKEPPRDGTVRRNAMAALYRIARLRRWRLYITIGLGDPAATAAVSGALQAAAGIASAVLSRQRPFRHLRPHIHVMPDMARRGLRVELSCIATMTPAHIIVAGTMYACSTAADWWQRRRLWWQQRGGRQRWPSIPFRV